MKGRTLLLWLAASLFASHTFAQQKVDIYCGVYGRMMGVFSSYWYVDFGKDSSRFTFKDATVKTQLQQKLKMGNPVDEINYMSGLGWQFVTQGKSGVNEIYYFKKSFDTSELVNPAKPVTGAN